MRVAALQMTSGPDVAANLEVAGRLIGEAASRGATLAALPENFAFMGQNDVDKRAVAESPGTGPIQAFLAGAAKQHGIWLVGGTMPMATGKPGATGADGRVAAASLVFAPTGERAGRYDKIHLFDVVLPDGLESYRESAHVRPGTDERVVETPAGRLGLSVCYDMRFPELFRRLSAQGAQVLVVPSAFTVPTGIAHWDTLLRARAIENQAFVIAPAQWGTHPNGRRTYGDSLIVDYWGTVLARQPSGIGCAIADLDLAAQAESRRQFPALAHRVL